MSSDPPEPLFHRDGNRFVPTGLTTGPWRADAMHGGPPAALVGLAVSESVGPGEHIARVNVELIRAVPLEPLAIVAERRRVSRRVSHVAVTVLAGDKPVTTGVAVVLSVASLPPPAWRAEEPWPPVPEADDTVAAPDFWTGGRATYHQHAVEHRMTTGSFAEPGPAVSWVRLLQPLVGGEPTPSLARVLAVADFGSGISAVYGHDGNVGLINADLSLALSRPGEGEWVRLESTTTAEPSGSGLAVTRLGDERGPIGVATQSLLGMRF